MSEFAKSIKLNVLRILAEQGVSKNELHRRTGISQGRISDLLNGECEMQTDTIQKIADALGVKFTELVVEHEHAV